MRLPVNAGKPMTLFYASRVNLPSNTRLKQSNLVSLLSLAIQRFQSQAQL
jgi:hypothetical protein